MNWLLLRENWKRSEEREEKKWNGKEIEVSEGRETSENGRGKERKTVVFKI